MVRKFCPGFNIRPRHTKCYFTEQLFLPWNTKTQLTAYLQLICLLICLHFNASWLNKNLEQHLNNAIWVSFLPWKRSATVQIEKSGDNWVYITVLSTGWLFSTDLLFNYSCQPYSICVAFERNSLRCSAKWQRPRKNLCILRSGSPNTDNSRSSV